jgi:hypothetical protein
MAGREGKLASTALATAVTATATAIAAISLDILHYLSTGPNTSV